MPNRGDVHLQMQNDGNKVLYTFQVASVGKPLWSVGRFCDSGYEVLFTKDDATFSHASSGQKVGTFTRKHGLYMGAMKLKNPASAFFGRQGQRGRKAYWQITRRRAT